MKYLFYLLLAFSIISCNTTTHNKEYAKQVEYSDNTILYRGGGHEVLIHEFGYNGHDYIWFSSAAQDCSATGGIVHNPDCYCFNKEINNK